MSNNIFSDSDQLYLAAAGLFARMRAEHPATIKPMYRARLIVRLSTSDPAGQIWVNARHNPLQTAFGPQPLRPELDIYMSADTLHRILMGEMSLPKAVGSGAVKVRGAVFKVAVMGDLFLKGQEVYPDVLREQGFSNI